MFPRRALNSIIFRLLNLIFTRVPDPERGDIIKNDINQEKNKISGSIRKKIENYFSGIANSIIHPGENNNCNCATQTSQASTSQ